MSADWKALLAMALGIVVACAFVTAVAELLWMARERRLTRAAWREMGLSLSLVPPNAAFALLTAGVWSSLFVEAQALAPRPLPVNAATVLLAFLAVDFSYYWEHRCAHRLRWLWNLYHAAHHSSPDYTVATAYRVSFLNQLLAPAFYLPWVLLGLHPLLVVSLQLVAFHYQAWLHTEWIGPLGAADRWLNTPAAHRLHHSAALAHRDRNLGAITLLWDRLFGTFAAAASIERYGIPGAPPPRTALAIYLQPWRSRR
jgi:sterol desaturase/sphingolipid hydroxylase (fatty acid hydroxylase superfamily)